MQAKFRPHWILFPIALAYYWWESENLLLPLYCPALFSFDRGHEFSITWKVDNDQSSHQLWYFLMQYRSVRGSWGKRWSVLHGIWHLSPSPWIFPYSLSETVVLTLVQLTSPHTILAWNFFFKTKTRLFWQPSLLVTLWGTSMLIYCWHEFKMEWHLKRGIRQYWWRVHAESLFALESTLVGKYPKISWQDVKEGCAW